MNEGSETVLAISSSNNIRCIEAQLETYTSIESCSNGTVVVNELKLQSMSMPVNVPQDLSPSRLCKGQLK